MFFYKVGSDRLDVMSRFAVTMVLLNFSSLCGSRYVVTVPNNPTWKVRFNSSHEGWGRTRRGRRPKGCSSAYVRGVDLICAGV